MRFAFAYGRGLVFSVVIPFAWIAPLNAASVWQAPATKATQFLVSQQNMDGSWGQSEGELFLVTSEVVRSLAAYQQKSPAYYAGLTFLQNNNPGNVDHQARAILALQPQGALLTGNIAFLRNTQNLVAPGNGGWGVSSAFLGSSPDTALALEAGNLVGGIGNYGNATSYLKSTQLTAIADKGWAVGNNAVSDALATALVVQALVPYRATDVSLATPIANAVATLGAQVTNASPTATQAHVALALLRDNPSSAPAANLLVYLVGVQGQNGDWNGDIYTTAVALRALSAAMQSDLAALGLRVDLLDQNLRAAINDALGRDQISNLTRGDLVQLTTLDISNRGIRNLGGLQYATRLTSLNAQNNQIGSTAPLDGLTQLTTIQLQGNPVFVAGNGNNDNDVPTLPEWGAILMAILLIAVGARSAKRHTPGGYA